MADNVDPMVTMSAWVKGISLSVLASVIGAASKLAIRKSWILEHRWGEQDEANASSDDVVYQVSSTEDLDDRDDALSNPVSHNINQAAQFGGSLSSYPYATQCAGDNSDDSTDDVTPSTLESSGMGECHHAPPREPCGRPWWIPKTLRYSGMVGMTFLNPVASVLAMRYASPSILAPFSGLTLVWIVLLSQPLLDEPPRATQLLAAGLIIAGEVIVALFGDHTNDEGVKLMDIEQSYREPAFLSYFAVMIMWMLFLAYCMRCGGGPVVRKMAWGISGGSVTGLQNFLKDSLTIVKVVPVHDAPWYLFLFVLLAIATAFAGLLLLTACMKRYDATYSAATFVGSFVMSASIMSAIHYKTFDQLKGVASRCFYPAGLLILLIGVLLLVHESKLRDDDSQRLPEQNDGESLQDDVAHEWLHSHRSQTSATLGEPLVQAELPTAARELS